MCVGQVWGVEVMVRRISKTTAVNFNAKEHLDLFIISV